MRNYDLSRIPVYAKAMPGLLKGYLSQAADIALGIEPDAACSWSCNFAEMLLVREMGYGNRYSVLERARIDQLRKLFDCWLVSNSMSNSLTACKMNFLFSLIRAVNLCEPREYKKALAKSRVFLLMAWDYCQNLENSPESPNVA